MVATVGNAAGKEGAAVSWRSWFQFLGWGRRGGAAGSCGALGVSLQTPQPSPLGGSHAWEEDSCTWRTMVLGNSLPFSKRRVSLLAVDGYLM